MYNVLIKGVFLYNKEKENMKQIQIPLGMKDTILEECRTKRMLQANIEKVFASYGYSEIITPSIEFYSTYQNAFNEINEQDMYQFFDQDGQILALRMDMTVPIARVCASKFSNSEPPFRFRYCSNVYKVRQMFAGKRGEVTDCGVELIGLDDTSDLEVLSLALDTMETFGIQDYQLEIGNSDFFKKACEHVCLDASQQLVLADLIDRKSMVELREYLEPLALEPSQRAFFQALPLLGGDASCLQKAKELSFTEPLKKVVEKLQQLYNQLCRLGYEKHITFDLGKVPHLNYYTGIIFEGFVAGCGHSVLSGGRYDHLLETFGRDLPACGFSVKVDYLIDVIHAPAEKKIRICYPAGKEVEALQRAKDLRKQGNVILQPWEKPEVEVFL